MESSLTASPQIQKVPAFKDRHLTAAKAIERRQKQNERQKLKRKLQQEQQAKKKSNSINSAILVGGDSSEKENIDPNIPSPFSSSSSSISSPSLPFSVTLSVSDLIIPLHRPDIHAERSRLREWYYQHSSLPLDLIRALLRNTAAYSVSALSSMLSLYSGHSCPSIDALTDYEISIVFEYACLKCRLTGKTPNSTSLIYLANLITLLNFIGGVYHFRCGCLGLGNSTQCLAKHSSGKCDWKASLGRRGELTIDHHPAKKKTSRASGWTVCIASGGTASYTMRAEISSWWWSIKSTSHPFRCNTCNKFSGNKKMNDDDSESDEYDEEDNDNEEDE